MIRQHTKNIAKGSSAAGKKDGVERSHLFFSFERDNMKRNEMFCKSCGQMTREGKIEGRIKYRDHPIWKTDFKKPLSELIEDIRTELSRVRGKVTDIIYGYDCTDLYRSIKDVEGLLTCGLVTLAHIKDERLKHEKMMEARKENKTS